MRQKELPQTESAGAVQCPPFVPRGTQRSNYYLLPTGFHLDINNLTRTLRKNLFPSSIIENVVRKFLNNYFNPDSCLGCSACYIGRTNRHFATRIREHLASDEHSHIFKHLGGSENCRSLCSEDCFKILESASTRFQLKVKEAMHILWEQPSLNSQVKHLN